MYNRIKDILLQHRGKASAISAKEISRQIGFPMEDTQAVSRQAIKRTEEMFSLPIISCNKGYFIAETAEEMKQYCSNINKRIDGMKERMNRAQLYFLEWKK